MYTDLLVYKNDAKNVYSNSSIENSWANLAQMFVIASARRRFFQKKFWENRPEKSLALIYIGIGFITNVPVPLRASIGA